MKVDMEKYILRRFFRQLIILFGVSVLTFIITSAATGGTAGGRVPAGGVVVWNGSYVSRYLAWMRFIFFNSDYSSSFAMKRSVIANFGQMLPGTIQIACLSMFATILVSLTFGFLAAIYKNSFTDFIIRFFSFVGISIPNYLIGLLLIFTFVVKYRWFHVTIFTDPKSIVLPICALTIPLISRYVRQVRGAVLEELNQDYVIGASARGVHRWRINCLHVLPNILPPVLSSLGIVAGQLLSGIVVVETLFAWHGVGGMTVNSIRAQEYMVIQAYVLWTAFFYVAFSFIIDIIIYLSEPHLHRKERLNA
jgi:peptide/nickel transport system permease protein